jgi:hypothetical protein
MLDGFHDILVPLYRWMVYKGKSYESMDDVGVPPMTLEASILSLFWRNIWKLPRKLGQNMHEIIIMK